ncbi:hypothetical protein [Undibacterium fentianense]|uniref:Dienelactone hydrolase domain-containing protein n=1 Tax=Undibacterium fentianense TaxID=2828728 RepID=A0A941E5R9_9BURK|nr:hypothetical protein [Undibacterium fentianense]MBR7801582.1 hypothetical protein [Undibacterium fentianense]
MSATVFIVTDIFGFTPAIASLQRFLAPAIDTTSKPVCQIITPFDETPTFRNEQEAYQFYLASGGIRAYADKILRLSMCSPAVRHVIAFSAGASAWWLGCASQVNRLHPSLESSSLFYASRVRDYLDLESSFPCHFIFAETEPAYQPIEIVEALRARQHQAEIARGTRHGFMNPYSSGFSLKQQSHYFDVLYQKLHPKKALVAA